MKKTYILFILILFVSNVYGKICMTDTTAKNCKHIDSVHITKISNLLQDGISVYQNNAFNIIYIKSNNKKINRLMLSNSSGQVINIVNVNNNRSTLDMSRLNKGLYILTIETKDNTYSIKLMKN